MSGQPILVIGEHFSGKPRPVSLELVTAGRQLADASGASVSVLVAGSAVDDLAASFAALAGVDEVVKVEHEALAPFLPGPWTGAVAGAIRQLDPSIVLIPSSITGRDYAARVAARLGAPLVADAFALTIEHGALVASRAVLGARVQTDVTFTGSGPALVTIAPGAFPKAAPGDQPAPVRQLQVDIEPRDRWVTLVEQRAHTAGARGLTDADRIVAGGRGLGKPENFELVEDLAAAMNAAVGASGATVGAGWRSHNDQVGSTGHIVSPKLYVAVGISGAPQHLVGMAGSENVVAINRDSEAPIFKVASFGIVGDLFEVVPALAARLRASDD